MMLFKGNKISKEKIYKMMEENPALIEMVSSPDYNACLIAYKKDPLSFLLIQKFSYKFLNYAMFQSKKEWLILCKVIFLSDTYRSSDIARLLSRISLNGISKNKVEQFNVAWKKHNIFRKIQNL